MPMIFNFILRFLFFACWGIGEASEKPNFVFILADDCTYLDMEVYGGPSKTPHILRLAEEGMTFTRCYQSASMCSPTRHALYTGIHPIRNGAYPNHARAYENVRSVPHFLSRENYRVVLAGKSIRTGIRLSLRIPR